MKHNFSFKYLDLNIILSFYICFDIATESSGIFQGPGYYR